MLEVTRYLASPYFRLLICVACLHGKAEWSLAQETVFDQSVLKKWNEYELFSRSIQGTLQRTTTGLISGTTSTYSKRFAQNHDCAMLCSTLGRESTEFCFVANPRYSASVTRSTADPNAVLLEKYEPDPNAVLPHSSASLFDDMFVITSPQFCYCEKRLSAVLFSPTFKMGQVSRVSLNGRQLVRIDHTYVDETPGSPKQESRRKGSIYLDPSRCWSVDHVIESEEYLLNDKLDHNTEWRIQYETRDHPSGFPIIKSQELTTTGYVHRLKKKHGARIKESFELKINEHVPDVDFTLSALGLPEPSDGATQKRIPAYLWILAGAGVSGALALGFWYLARRNRTTQVA